jgi:hypothetical protein
MNEAEDTPNDPNQSIDIFFNNLDEITQKKIMESTMQALNVLDTDEFGNKKIVEAFGKNPLVTLSAKDITQRIKFEI